MVHDHAEGVKTGRRLAVKAHGGFMKRMPGPALAGLERLDARSPKTGYDTGDSSIDLPIALLRLLIGHARSLATWFRLGRHEPAGNGGIPGPMVLCVSPPGAFGKWRSGPTSRQGMRGRTGSACGRA